MHVRVKSVRSLGRGEAMGSAVLARLIEEVRNEDKNVARSYDRTHNRHNR
jgi:hypothetical protein